VGGGARGTATSVLLLSSRWTRILSKIKGYCLFVASVLRLALMAR
jgi:hypothetical protein